MPRIAQPVALSTRPAADPAAARSFAYCEQLARRAAANFYHAFRLLPAGQRRVLSFLLSTGLLGIMARLGLMEGTIAQLSRQNLSYAPFTQLANLTGTPAMSVPLHWTAEGLPMGVQFIAKFGGEPQLLQLASQLERSTPWIHRQPPLACQR